jgi:hypothetical protein
MKKYLFCLKTIVFINKGRVKIVSFFTEVILDLQGKNFEKYFLETNGFLLKFLATIKKAMTPGKSVEMSISFDHSEIA